MKILYAVQATGNGHISRAMELLPHLSMYGKVDVLLSGNNSTLSPELPIVYRSKGLSLYYNCTGKIDHWRFLNHLNLFRLGKDIKGLPVSTYDLVINDFDFITSMACKLKKVQSIHVGHQASFSSPHTPRPQIQNSTGEFILKNFVHAQRNIGLHFKNYDDFISIPVIREKIIEASPKNEGHITVYLPSYCEKQLIEVLKPLAPQRFELFSFETSKPRVDGNIKFFPVDSALFSTSMINCKAIITGGGFETPAEAIHLGKKILSIPISGQYEQQCNAAALEQLGVMTLPKITENFKDDFHHWETNYQPIQLDYSQGIPELLSKLFN